MKGTDDYDDDDGDDDHDDGLDVKDPATLGFDNVKNGIFLLQHETRSCVILHHSNGSLEGHRFSWKHCDTYHRHLKSLGV